MGIEFTQFLRPYGHRVQVYIDRPPDIERMAKEIIAHGHRFEVEELRTGMVSFTVSAVSNDDPDIAIELCTNGPAVLDAVDRLVTRTYNALQAFKSVKDKNNVQ